MSMMVPDTDPLRPRFFTRFRVVGLWVFLITSVIMVIMLFYIHHFLSSHISLLNQVGWFEHFDSKTDFDFAVSCLRSKLCRPEFMKAFEGLNGKVAQIALLIPLFFPLAIYLIWPKRNKIYRARFAFIYELGDLILNLNNKAKYMLPLLQFDGRLIGFEYDKKKRKQLNHLAVVAPTQSGKSVWVKFVLGSFKGSVVVVDIKGELYEDTANYRQTITDVFRLELTGKGTRYNPLADMGTSAIELRSIAELLVVDPSDKEQIFSQRAIPAIRAALRAAILQDEPPIPYLLNLISQGAVKFVTVLSKEDDELIQKDLVLFLGMSIEEFEAEGYKQFQEKGFLSSTWGTMTTRLEPFGSPEIMHLFSGNDFYAGDLLTLDEHGKGMSVYLTFPEHVLQGASQVIALILRGLFSGMSHHSDKQGGAELPCLALLDELPQYKMPTLSKTITTILSRGVTLVPIVQSKEQLIESYGKSDAVTILDNCKLQMYLSPEGDTAKELSETLGYREVQKFSFSESDKGDRKNKNYEKRLLMTPDELRLLPKEDAILLVNGRRPIRGKRLLWYKDKTISKRLKP